MPALTDRQMDAKLLAEANAAAAAANTGNGADARYDQKAAGIPSVSDKTGNTASGPTVIGPTGSGPTGSGPTGSGPTGSGPTGSGPTGSGPTGSGPTGSGPTGSGPTGSGPTGSGPVRPTPLGNVYVDSNGHNMQKMSDGSTVDLGMSESGAATVATRQNAFDLLRDQFTSFGVLKKNADGSYTSSSQGLLDTVKSLIMSGAGADTASITLQESDAYKARFAGNTARLNAGLRVLSPNEYIQTENAYDQVLKASGFPAGYSNQDKWAQFIGNDMSAAELSDRVATASKSIANQDPFYAQTLQNYYGLSNGDMIAHVLDPAATLPLLQRQAASASIGAAASKQGLGISAYAAQSLYANNISEAQAQQGFRNVALNIAPEQRIAARFGGDAAAQGQNLVASTFGLSGAAYAEQQMRALNTRETNEFSGSAGASKGSLYSENSGTL